MPGTGKRRYFFLRPPDFLAAQNEIPARMAFCWTAAAVRPSWRATSLVGVPALASCFRLRNSPALQEEPSFEGRFAISLLSNHPMRVCWNDSRRFWPPRAQHGVLTCCKSLCFWDGNSSLHMPRTRASLPRLFRKGRAQLLQVERIDVGNGPELQPALTPTCHVIASVAPCCGHGFAGTGGPHKHVDDVLPSSIYDSRHHLAVKVVEAPANQREPPVGELEHRRREIHFPRKPGLHH